MEIEGPNHIDVVTLLLRIVVLEANAVFITQLMVEFPDPLAEGARRGHRATRQIRPRVGHRKQVGNRLQPAHHIGTLSIGQGLNHARRGSVAAGDFEAHEEECLVFADWAAQRHPRGSDGEGRLFSKRRIPRVEGCILEKRVQGAMKRIGTPPCDQIGHAACRPSVLCLEVAGLHFDTFHGLHRHRLLRQALRQEPTVIDVDELCAVHHNVHRAVGSRAVHVEGSMGCAL